MNFAECKKQQQDMAAWLVGKKFTVFGTLKFTFGHNVTDRHGEKLLRKFFNKLDIIYLGSNLVDSGCRIERAVFMQTGTSGSNLHYHFLAKPIGDINFFCETARCVWAETSDFTMSFKHTVVDEVRNLEACGMYCGHEFWVHGADTIVLAVTHNSGPTLTSNPIYAQRRLDKRHENNEMTKKREYDCAISANDRRLGKSRNIAGNTATH
jgi:hypothetical protein